jgi:hypothetical protein
MNTNKGVIADSFLAPSSLLLLAGLALLPLGATGCTRKEEIATSQQSRAEKSKTASRDVQNSTSVGIADSCVEIAPPPFLFVGVSWLGKNGFVAIQEPNTHTSAWYRIGDKIDNYELSSLRDGLLLIRANGKEFQLPLMGIELTQVVSESVKEATASPLSSPTIKVWANGVGVEAGPNQMPPELLKIYNDSKEALLNAKVSKDIEPMIAQALESNVVVVSSSTDGVKRSDFPPELAAKLDDATLAKINADIKAHPAAIPSGSPVK